MRALLDSRAARARRRCGPRRRSRRRATSAARAPRDDDAWARRHRRPRSRAARGRRCAASSTPPASCCTRTSAAPRSPTRRSTRSRASPADTPTSSSTSTRGARGSRYVHCASLLRELTGAEDALVVNNCAAALVLALNTLADGREAILSRGELVEIGGSFRVHDIMAKSGARLREVGTTNRTHLADYAARDRRPTPARSLKVHRSNFAVRRVRRRGDGARARAARARRTGCRSCTTSAAGCSSRSTRSACAASRRRARRSRAGATIVVMSGDKLLGGPQAGFIVGDARWLDAMRRNPLARSYRVDKLTLAALEATLALYRDPARALREIPTLALLAATPGALRARAESLRLALRRDGVDGETVETTGSVGAGAFPDARAPGRRGRARRRRRGVGARGFGRGRRRSSAACTTGGCSRPARGARARAARARARRGGRAWLTRRGRRAALLDRDGTIIADEHYLADPDRVALLPGAADAISLLARAGVPSIVCTNQSGIARGLVTLEQYRAVRVRVGRAARGRRRDAAGLVRLPAPRAVHRTVRVPQAGHAAVRARRGAARARSLALACSSATSTATSRPALRFGGAGVPGALARHARGARDARARRGRRRGRLAARRGAALSWSARR